MEAFHSCRIRIQSAAFISCKYFVIQIILKSFSLFFINQIGSQKCNTPCAAFTCCLHYGNRCIYRVCKDLLAHTLCLKESAVSQKSDRKSVV